MRACICGHSKPVHTHLRAGTSCSAANCACPEFHRKWFFRRSEARPTLTLSKKSSDDSQAA
jgi:hypothetical protein